MRTVLVTSGGGFQGMALIEALRQVPQTRIVLADCFDENVGRYHVARFLRAPLLKDEEAFLAFVEATCRQEAVDMVLPATELELDVLARGRDCIERIGAALMVSSPQVLSIGKDKLVLHDWLQSLGLPCLPTAASPTAPGLALPLIGKPRGGWGGRGTVALRSQADLERAVRAHPADMAWQPLLDEFSEVSVDFAINPAGRTSTLGARSRLRTLSGFALIGQPVSDTQLLACAQRVADALAAAGGLGVFNLQFLRQAHKQRDWRRALQPLVR